MRIRTEDLLVTTNPRAHTTRLLVVVTALTFAGACTTEMTETPQDTAEHSDPRDITQWSPSFTPSSSPITSTDESQSRMDQVVKILEAHDLSIPDSENDLPDLIRTVSSFDAPELWAQCLTDQGFESSAPGGVVTTNDVVPEQQEIYWQTYADCVAQYPINAEYFQTWGEDQWRVQHEYLVEYFIPCVESYGIAINKDAIPEERTFVEAGLSDGDIWHPAFEWMADPDYQNLANTETPEGAEVATTCRQSPPENKLFG